MALRSNKPCVHRWVLSDPSMTTIRAICRRCGAQRDYPSVLELDCHQLVPNYEELDQGAIMVALAQAPLEEETHV